MSERGPRSRTLRNPTRLVAVLIVVCAAVLVDTAVAIDGVGWEPPLLNAIPVILRPSPGNNVVALLALVLSGLSVQLGLHHSPRRRRAWLIGMAVLTIFWGGSFYASILGSYSIVSWLAWTMGLFAGLVEPTAPAPFPLAFQLARFCGLATLFSVAGSILAGAARTHLDRIWLARANDVDVVIGIDPSAVDLSKALLHERNRDKGSWPRWRAAGGVVVVHSEPSHPVLAELRDHGCRIVTGDIGSESFLRDLLLTRGRPTVHRLFALTPSETVNTRLVMAAADLVEQHSDGLDRLHVPRLIARYDDPRRARGWRLASLGTARCFVDAITQEECTARALVDQLAIDRSEQLIILGDTALTSALMMELAVQRAFRHELTEAARSHGNPEPVPLRVDRVLICHPMAEHTLTEWIRHRAPASDLPTPLSVTAHTESWEDLLKTHASATPTTVIIVGEPARDLRARATRLSILSPRCRIFVPEPDTFGVPEGDLPRTRDNLKGYGLTLLMGRKVPEDSWVTLARQTHEVYVATNPPSQVQARRHWEGPPALPEFFREDNLRQQRQLMTKMHQAHQWGSLRSSTDPGTGWMHVAAGESGAPVSEATIRWLAEAEHNRWCEMRLRQRWTTAGPEDTDPVEAEKHQRNKNLVEWESGRPLAPARIGEELGVDTGQLRKWNEIAIRSLLHRLWVVGIAPAKPSGKRFRRRGYVRAIKLEEARSWTTPHGNILTSAPGDWWITDTKGNERGVSANEFTTLYRPLVNGCEGKYLRIGEITARQAQTVDTVITLEGEALVTPGTWIIVDDRGNVWPVPEDEFDSLYEQIDAEP